jgi:hypothetical protein
VTPFSVQGVCAQQRGLVIVHGLVALFLEVIALAIILLLIGLAVLRVLILATRTIVVLIILIMIVGSLIVMWVALMIVEVLVAMMLPVAWFTAAHERKMSHLLLYWLLFVLGDLLKNASCFVSRLTLLKKVMSLSGSVGIVLFVSRNLNWCALGCVKKICSLFSCAMGTYHLLEVATIKVAEELYSTSHGFMHWHEGGFLGSTKPADQLVANIGEPRDCLRVIPDAFIKVRLCTVCVGGALLGNNAIHLVRRTS